MATYLNCVLLGAPSTGKTSLAQALSGGRCINGVFEAAVTDPNSRHKLVFRLKERAREELWKEAVCGLVVYDVTNEDSYRCAKEEIIPSLLCHLDSDRSFLILLGNHCDHSSIRPIPSQDAEEFAANNAIFHLEVSAPLRKNIELTLKVMRIRALSLIKRFPEMCKGCEKRLELDIGSVRGEEEPGRRHLTPQFSERSAEMKRNSFREEEKEVDREGEQRADPSTSETNLSFANMSNISSGDDYPSSRTSLAQATEPPPPLPTRSGAETERRTEKYSEAQGGSGTERERGRNIVMSVEVRLGVEGTVTVPIYEDDSSIEVSQRCLGGLSASPDLVESLAELIEGKVARYCQEIRSVKRQEGTDRGGKVLFRIKVNIGARPRDLIVREGADLPSLAHSFAQEHGLTPELQGQVAALLTRAYQQYSDRLAGA